MKLYHVSYDPVPEFIPRVPQHRMIAEDNTVRRICFSTSIEKCIEAKPGGNLPIYLMFENGFHPLLYIYVIDTDTLPAECILGPAILHEQFGVDDAIANDEHWIIDTVIQPREIVREVLDVEWTSLDDPHINYLELTSDISDDCRYVHKFMSCMCEQSEENYTTDTIIINMIEDIAPHLRKGIRKIYERRNKQMREYTLNEYRQIEDDRKSIFTPDAKYPWKHTIADGEKILVEGIDFRIVPTSAELDAIAKQMLDNIDNEKVRGYHPWYFSGSFEVDTNTLLIAETREDRYLDVSIWYFEPFPKPTRLRTVSAGAIVKRVCAYNQKALAKRLERLFYLMGRL